MFKNEDLINEYLNERAELVAFLDDKLLEYSLQLKLSNLVLKSDAMMEALKKP